MLLPKILVVLAVALALQTSASAASLVRLVCDGDAEGAIVRVDGRVLGECPLDARVEAGTHEFRVVKPFGQFKEQVFAQKITLGDGVSKRIEVVLGAPDFTPEGRKLEDERVRRVKEQQAQEEARKREEVAKAERARRDAWEARLAAIRTQGAEAGNGKSFKDCPDCPAMVLISEDGKGVLAVGQFEITRGQFAQFVSEARRTMPKGCSEYVNVTWGLLNGFTKGWEKNEELNWLNPGFPQDDTHPVVCVTADDATSYANWLSQKTGTRYAPMDEKTVSRLIKSPSFERTGVLTNELWAPSIKSLLGTSDPVAACKFANVNGDQATKDRHSLTLTDVKSFPCDDGYTHTAPVGHFLPNAIGIYDLMGNVAEIVIRAKPADKNNSDTYTFGGSWAAQYGFFNNEPTLSDSSGLVPSYRSPRQTNVGFRVVSDLSLLDGSRPPVSSPIQRQPTAAATEPPRVKPEGAPVLAPTPSRPQLPFQLSEEVWKAIESSELYRNAPKPVPLTVRYLYQVETKYTGSKVSGQLQPPSKPEMEELVVQLIPISDKCVRMSRRQSVNSVVTQTDHYSCAGGFLHLGTTGSRILSRIGHIQGSIFPLRLGARIDIDSQLISVQEPTGKMTSSAFQCEVTNSVPAQQLHPSLRGTAWQMCGKNYYMESLGAFLGTPLRNARGELENQIPKVGQTYVAAEHKNPEYGFVRTKTFLEYSIAPE